jgi:hypothetical protein
MDSVILDWFWFSLLAIVVFDIVVRALAATSSRLWTCPSTIFVHIILFFNIKFNLICLIIKPLAVKQYDYL